MCSSFGGDACSRFHPFTAPAGHHQPPTPAVTFEAGPAVLTGAGVGAAARPGRTPWPSVQAYSDHSAPGSGSHRDGTVASTSRRSFQTAGDAGVMNHWAPGGTARDAGGPVLAPFPPTFTGELLPPPVVSGGRNKRMRSSTEGTKRKRH
ncbi:unnamed protein product [Sphacelaria rigidula]